MENKLFHSDVYIPSRLLALCPTGKVEVTYGFHAQRSAKTDRYGEILLPASLFLSRESVIEIETENGRIVKVLYRLPYSKKYNLCVAFIPGQNFVKTVWLNSTTDNHQTLDISKYSVL